MPMFWLFYLLSNFLNTAKGTRDFKVAISTPDYRSHAILICDKTRHDLKLNGVLSWTHATGFAVDVFLMHIPCHSKICHLTFLSFTNQNISCGQVTMDNLRDKKFL